MRDFYKPDGAMKDYLDSYYTTFFVVGGDWSKVLFTHETVDLIMKDVKKIKPEELKANGQVLWDKAWKCNFLGTCKPRNDGILYPGEINSNMAVRLEMNEACLEKKRHKCLEMTFKS